MGMDNRSLCSIVQNLVVVDALFGELNEAWSHDNKPYSFLLKGPCIPRRPRKEAFEVRT